jgi:flagellar hook-length control protein FliK
MQNLLPITPALKNGADKNNFNADKSAAEPNSSFQMLLNQQVNSQKGSTQQKTVHKNSNKQVDTALEEQMIAEQKKDEPKNDDFLSNTGNFPMEQVELKPKATLAVDEDVDTQTEKAANNITDTGTISLTTTASPLVMWASVTSASTLTNTVQNQLVNIGKHTLVAQDVMLSNALAQGKNIQTTSVPQNDIQATQPIAENKLATEQTRWLDGLMPTLTKQNADGESVSAKMMLNTIKETSDKNLDTKNVVVPSSQPLQVAQPNINAPLQQTGSSNNINAYFGKSGWDQAISQKVVWMVGAGEQSATLTLNPPDLGPLQVVINVQNDKADTTFISDNAEVRQALQDGISNLREKMSESGIQLGQASVSSGGPSQQEFQQAQRNQLAPQLISNTLALPVEKISRTNTIIRTANGLVDTFV